MKKWIYLLLLAVALFMTLITGVYAPVLALTYHDEYIHFPDYIVTDYNDIPVVINENTFNNKINGWLKYSFNVKFSSCPSSKKTLVMYSDLMDKTMAIRANFVENIEINCSTNYQTIEKTTYFDEDDLSSALISKIKSALTNADDEYIYFRQRIYNNRNYEQNIFNGVTMTFRNIELTSTIIYEFNTTYYFDHLALDTTINYPVGINANVYNYDNLGNSNVALILFYDSTDYYRIWNTDYTNVANRPRTKYHIPLNDKVTAYGIGVSNYTVMPYSPTVPSADFVISSGVDNTILFTNIFYLLNYSNTQQAFPSADTLPIWEYDTCNAWDIPCHLGNALVYLAKDAPITSDIYQIASSGWQFISNGFYAVTSLFGANFDENGNLLSGNAFGVLLLISLGILLISWGVSGDD